MRCFATLKCENCPEAIFTEFDLDEASQARQQRAMEERVMEVWSSFTCSACDYDRAYVLGFGPSLALKTL